MRDRPAAWQRTAGVAVPAGLADEGVAIELFAGDRVGPEGADDRQELRGRAGVVLLIETGQHDVGVGRRLPADRGGEHHAVVGHLVDERVGIARAGDDTHRDSIRTDERGVGKEGVRTGRYRGTQCRYEKTTR